MIRPLMKFYICKRSGLINPRPSEFGERTTIIPSVGHCEEVWV
jgi:hypothetical protein